MKTPQLLGLGLGIALCGTAWADGALDPTALGSIDGMVAACTQANPGGSAAYEGLRATVIGEQGEAEVKAATQTPEYRDAYEAAHQKSEGEERDAVLKQCATLATAMGPRVHQRPQPNVRSKTNGKSAASAKPAAARPAGDAAAEPAKKPATH